MTVKNCTCYGVPDVEMLDMLTIAVTKDEDGEVSVFNGGFCEEFEPVLNDYEEMECITDAADVEVDSICLLAEMCDLDDELTEIPQDTPLLVFTIHVSSEHLWLEIITNREAYDDNPAFRTFAEAAEFHMKGFVMVLERFLAE